MFDVTSDANVTAEDVQVSATHIEFRATDLLATGYTRLKAKRDLVLDMTGDTTFERALLKASERELAVAGTTFTVGGPTASPSKIQVGKSASFEVDVSGAVSLERARLRIGSSPVSIIRGSDITHRLGQIRGPAGSSLELSAPTGTCDLTGTQIAGAGVTTNCATVIGP